MADETPNDDCSWWATWLGCSGVMAAVVGIVIVAVALDERDFDPLDLCRPGESGECMRATTGVIASTDVRFADATVDYDDGTKSVDVTLSEYEPPAPGTRVTLEWWDGEVVALVERDGGWRYKTLDWPGPWWKWPLVFVFCMVTVGVALGVVFGIAALPGRLWRRRGPMKRLGRG